MQEAMGLISVSAQTKMHSPLQQELNTLPGFRFHPTDEELFRYFLEPAAKGEQLPLRAIGMVDLYSYYPWELPALSKIGSKKEWHYFVLRDRNKQNGRRPNRIAKSGFWKATGSDRVIYGRLKSALGLRKTLVYYTGKAPKGCKTDWVMKEYRLPDNCTLPLDIVLCKIYQKATTLMALEQSYEKISLAMKQGTNNAHTTVFSQQEFSIPYNFDIRIEFQGNGSNENEGEALSKIIGEQSQLSCLTVADPKIIDPLESFLDNLQDEMFATLHRGNQSTIESDSSFDCGFYPWTNMKDDDGNQDAVGNYENQNQSDNFPSEISVTMYPEIHSSTENGGSSLKQFGANLPELQHSNLNNSSGMLDPFSLYCPWVDHTSTSTMLIENIGPQVAPTAMLTNFK